MRARIAKNIGVPAIVIIAMAAVACYSLWGASVLHYERQAASGHVQVAVGN